MDLIDVMRTTGTCRYYTDRHVPDEALYAAFDAARCAPQGGNRQPVRFVVIRDQDTKQALSDLYQPMWRAYYDGIHSGAVRVGAVPKTVEAADHFARNLAHHPVLVVVCAEIESLHATDSALDRVSVVGGASVYPTVQNFCLALRDQGIASALTTLLCSVEPDVTELLGIPEGFLTAAHLAVGYPAKPFPTRLTRTPVEEFVYLDTFGSPLFGS
ncbi:nitroreductase family protein [Streptomyces sp. NPDC091280]|uniref:nitroreductase family protein n=1 Tax=unclassified Streptomyces TaxID=2593676 RepID=UPI00381BF87E